MSLSVNPLPAVYRRRRRGRSGAPQGAPVMGPLPSSMVLAERATASLAEFLRGHDIGHWPVYFNNASDLDDIDRHLQDLGEGDARWDPHPPQVAGGHQPWALTSDRERQNEPNAEGKYDVEEQFRLLPAGVLYLRKHQVVVARWHYYAQENHCWIGVWLWAAPTPEHHQKLRDQLAEFRRRRARNTWHVVSGDSWRDEEIAREGSLTWDSIVLSPSIRQRLETELTTFFSPQAATVYKDLGVPYRRGVLLHGPPGNGKTSIIRIVGSANPEIPGIVIRPGGDFGDADFQRVVENWRDQAPSILVIEDLDWLLPRVSVSTFLNLIDGLDRHDGGLMLIATSNHPEKLDPAINNRPGRFDVVIEVPCPDRGQRLEYFARSRLAPLGPDLLRKLADQSEGLSFAHLREIESLSGLYAIKEARAARTEADVFTAIELVNKGYEEAKRGFPEQAQPFGLSQFHGGTASKNKNDRDDDLPF